MLCFSQRDLQYVAAIREDTTINLPGRTGVRDIISVK
jgi:hypothetical protein